MTTPKGETSHSGKPRIGKTMKIPKNVLCSKNENEGPDFAELAPKANLSHTKPGDTNKKVNFDLMPLEGLGILPEFHF